MILTFDLGNTRLHGALFFEDQLLAKFNYPNTKALRVTDLSLALGTFIKEHNISDENLIGISCASVDHECFEKFKQALKIYLAKEVFMVEARTVNALKIRYELPHSLGCDRVASALAAVTLFPDKNVLVFDLGTATTASVITRKKEFLGGWIVPGLSTAANSLHLTTSLLPEVQIHKGSATLATNTVDAIRNGLYLQTLYYMKGLIEQTKQNVFYGDEMMVIGTGGWSALFEQENLFHHVVQDLTLLGVKAAFNQHTENNHRRIYETNIDESQNTQSHSDRRRSALRGIHFDRSQAV